MIQGIKSIQNEILLDLNLLINKVNKMEQKNRQKNRIYQQTQVRFDRCSCLNQTETTSVATVKTMGSKKSTLTANNKAKNQKSQSKQKARHGLRLSKYISQQNQVISLEHNNKQGRNLKDGRSEGLNSGAVLGNKIQEFAGRTFHNTNFHHTNSNYWKNGQDIYINSNINKSYTITNSNLINNGVSPQKCLKGLRSLSINNNIETNRKIPSHSQYKAQRVYINQKIISITHPQVRQQNPKSYACKTVMQKTPTGGQIIIKPSIQVSSFQIQYKQRQSLPISLNVPPPINPQLIKNYQTATNGGRVHPSIANCRIPRVINANTLTNINTQYFHHQATQLTSNIDNSHLQPPIQIYKYNSTSSTTLFETKETKRYEQEQSRSRSIMGQQNNQNSNINSSKFRDRADMENKSDDQRCQYDTCEIQSHNTQEIVQQQHCQSLLRDYQIIRDLNKIQVLNGQNSQVRKGTQQQQYKNSTNEEFQTPQSKIGLKLTPQTGNQPPTPMFPQIKPNQNFPTPASFTSQAPYPQIQHQSNTYQGSTIYKPTTPIKKIKDFSAVREVQTINSDSISAELCDFSQVNMGSIPGAKRRGKIVSTESDLDIYQDNCTLLNQIYMQNKRQQGSNNDNNRLCSFIKRQKCKYYKQGQKQIYSYRTVYENKQYEFFQNDLTFLNSYDHNCEAQNKFQTKSIIPQVPKDKSNLQNPMKVGMEIEKEMRRLLFN